MGNILFLRELRRKDLEQKKQVVTVVKFRNMEHRYRLMNVLWQHPQCKVYCHTLYELQCLQVHAESHMNVYNQQSKDYLQVRSRALQIMLKATYMFFQSEFLSGLLHE